MSQGASAPPEPTFFASAADFRAWLEANYDKAPELWMGFYKKGSPQKGITYKEAVDEALCFGWIDSVARSIDAVSYGQRFTPRRKRSIWSAVNNARVEALSRAGLMHPAGLAAFEQRDPARTNQYSSEQGEVRLAPPYEDLFRADRQAWDFFQSQPPSYRKPATWWVMSAKKEETRERRLATLMADSRAGRRIAPLTPRKRDRG